MIERDTELEVIRLRLRRAREDRGLTQVEVSYLLKINHHTINRMEIGRHRLSMELFLDLCRIYAIEPDRVVFGLADEWKYIQAERERQQAALDSMKRSRKSKKQMAEELAQKAAQKGVSDE